jgi:DAACS family dicarboxylate/amino acid:cation (Na+ or H+) symporter
MHDISDSNSAPVERPRGPFGWYQRAPLYLRIVAALVLGVVAGLRWGHSAVHLAPFSSVVLRLLGALATPLIFVAVIRALVKAKVSGRTGAHLLFLLFLNTTVAIIIGLVIANVIQPGAHTHVAAALARPPQEPFDPVRDLLGKLPGSVLKPLADNDIMGVIILALAVGAGLRKVREQVKDIESQRNAIALVEAFLDAGFSLIMVVLHWVLELIPFAVFCVVASNVGKEGLATFRPMIWFVAAVLTALALQAGYYLVRLRMASWVRPREFLSAGAEALWTAFSTASSAATLPVTFRCMRDKLGVREESVSLGVMVGGAFNHDGTALYEAMSALFISQILGRHLGLGEQLTVVFMSILASVGAAGIPEAGTVTMLAVFNAVHLPVEYIPMLLVVDWFLDRCRTAINVMGDMSVTCILDGKRRPDAAEEPPPAVEPAAAASDA